MIICVRQSKGCIATARINFQIKVSQCLNERSVNDITISIPPSVSFGFPDPDYCRLNFETNKVIAENICEADCIDRVETCNKF